MLTVLQGSRREGGVYQELVWGTVQILQVQMIGKGNLYIWCKSIRCIRDLAPRGTRVERLKKKQGLRPSQLDTLSPGRWIFPHGPSLSRSPLLCLCDHAGYRGNEAPSEGSPSVAHFLALILHVKVCWWCSVRGSCAYFQTCMWKGIVCGVGGGLSLSRFQCGCSAAQCSYHYKLSFLIRLKAME